MTHDGDGDDRMAARTGIGAGGARPDAHDAGGCPDDADAGRARAAAAAIDRATGSGTARPGGRTIDESHPTHAPAVPARARSR